MPFSGHHDSVAIQKSMVHPHRVSNPGFMGMHWGQEVPKLLRETKLVPNSIPKLPDLSPKLSVSPFFPTSLSFI
jgi:hypothetical protein